MIARHLRNLWAHVFVGVTPAWALASIVIALTPVALVACYENTAPDTLLASTGAICTFNTECPAGQVCGAISGRCQRCTADAECNAKQLCGPEGLCIPECASDRDCTAGTCTNGQCVGGGPVGADTGGLGGLVNIPGLGGLFGGGTTTGGSSDTDGTGTTGDTGGIGIPTINIDDLPQNLRDWLTENGLVDESGNVSLPDIPENKPPESDTGDTGSTGDTGEIPDGPRGPRACPSANALNQIDPTVCRIRECLVCRCFGLEDSKCKLAQKITSETTCRNDLSAFNCPYDEPVETVGFQD